MILLVGLPPLRVHHPFISLYITFISHMLYGLFNLLQIILVTLHDGTGGVWEPPARHFFSAQSHAVQPRTQAQSAFCLAKYSTGNKAAIKFDPPFRLSLLYSNSVYFYLSNLQFCKDDVRFITRLSYIWSLLSRLPSLFHLVL